MNIYLAIIALTLAPWLHPVDAAPVPVASVAASSRTQNKNPATNAVDGNLSTRWSARGSGEWIRFRLGDCTPVNAVEIAWLSGNRRVSDFSIETSEDGAAWTRVFKGKSSGATHQLESVRFASTPACFVRIVGFGNTENDWISITEVVIQGTVSGGEEIPVVACPK